MRTNADISNEPLTAKQRCFVEEFCIDFNGTQAAIRAGYGQAGARTEAWRLQHHAGVATAIRDAMAALRARCDASADRWLLEVLAISLAMPIPMRRPKTASR